MPPLSSPSTKTTQTLNTTRTLRKHKQEEKNKSNREHNFIATFASLDYVDHSLCEYLLIIALANILTIWSISYDNNKPLRFSSQPNMTKPQ